LSVIVFPVSNELIDDKGLICLCGAQLAEFLLFSLQRDQLLLGLWVKCPFVYRPNKPAVHLSSTLAPSLAL
jgi:hypothetical protein